MTKNKKILLSMAIMGIDLAVFFLPLTAIFLIYILMVNPLWFRDFLNTLDSPESQTKDDGH